MSKLEDMLEEQQNQSLASLETRVDAVEAKVVALNDKVTLTLALTITL
jgi:hypothetical protein